MFYMDLDRDLAIAQIPKAGLSSIRDWLGRDCRVVSNDDAMVVSRRVAFIRHPLERLKSAYSYLYWQQDYGRNTKSGAPLDSWESFVDYILENDNEHWRPQTLHCGDVPNIYHKFENLNEHWEKYRPGILDHNNHSTRLPTTDYRTDDILNMYADDLRVWESAT